MNEHWSEFVQNPSLLSSDLQTDEIVTKDKTQNWQSSISTTAKVDNPGSEKDDSDGWCEVDECPSGITGTLLQEPDIVENADRVISFTPEEGNKPFGIFID